MNFDDALTLCKQMHCRYWANEALFMAPAVAAIPAVRVVRAVCFRTNHHITLLCVLKYVYSQFVNILEHATQIHDGTSGKARPEILTSFPQNS